MTQQSFHEISLGTLDSVDSVVDNNIKQNSNKIICILYVPLESTTVFINVQVLTFSHSEEISKVSHDIVYGGWFKALDIA